MTLKDAMTATTSTSDATKTAADASFVGTCLQSVADGKELSSVQSQRTTAARELAQIILSSTTIAITELDSALQQELTQLVVKSTLSCKSLSKTKEMLWREFHAMRQARLKDVWKKFVTHSAAATGGLDDDPLLMQYVFEKLFDKVITSTFTVVTSETPEEPISANEENALRYAAGYVPRSLIAKLQSSGQQHSWSSSEQQAVLSCLHAMRASNDDDDESYDSFISYTRKWTKAINRGGLFLIKDEVYLLFFEMEKKMRKELSFMLRARRIDKDSVISSISSDDKVLSHWCVCAVSLEDETSKALLVKIIELWLTIRGFSTAGAYVEYYKRCCKKNTKKSTGLRKGLKRKYDSKSFDDSVCTEDRED